MRHAFFALLFVFGTIVCAGCEHIDLADDALTARSPAAAMDFVAPLEASGSTEGSSMLVESLLPIAERPTARTGTTRGNGYSSAIDAKLYERDFAPGVDGKAVPAPLVFGTGSASARLYCLLFLTDDMVSASVVHYPGLGLYNGPTRVSAFGMGFTGFPNPVAQVPAPLLPAGWTQTADQGVGSPARFVNADGFEITGYLIEVPLALAELSNGPDPADVTIDVTTVQAVGEGAVVSGVPLGRSAILRADQYTQSIAVSGVPILAGGNPLYPVVGVWFYQAP